MQKLIEALEVVKKECKKHNSQCDKCPMGTDDGICCVMECSPDDWAITEPTAIVRVMN